MGSLLGLAAPSQAHDLWIEPVAPVESGESVQIRVSVGHGDGAPEAVMRLPSRVDRLQVTSPDGTVTEPPGLDGSPLFGAFRPDGPGTWSVTYVSHPFLHILPAQRFADYLVEEGLESIGVERRERGEDTTPGRELVSRSVKTLVTVDDAELTDRVLDLPVELVLETADTDRVAFRLLVDGQPSIGVLVDFHRLDGHAAATSQRTDSDGRVSFEVPSAPSAADTATHSAWIASAVVVDRATDAHRRAAERDGEWRSRFASLTFHY